MSWIHDALRRGSRSADPASSGRSAHVDSVLHTLGYHPTRRSVTPGTWTAVALIAVLALAVIGWLMMPETASKLPTAVTKNAAKPYSVPEQAASTQPRQVPSPAPPAQATPPQPAPTVKPVPVVTARQPAPPRPTVTINGPMPFRDDFELGLYYQRSGEFDRALMHYKAVLERDELNVEAHNNLGMLYKDKGLLEDAAREFQRALFINTRYVRARVNLGATLLQMSRADEAAAEFRAALAIEPRNVDALVNLALAQKAAGQLQDARGTLIRALTVDPHAAAAHYNLAVEYEASGEAARALDHYRAFLEYAGPEYAPRAPGVRARIDVLSQRVK